MARLESNEAVKTSDLEKAERLLNELTGLLQNSNQTGLGSLDLTLLQGALRERKAEASDLDAAESIDPSRAPDFSLFNGPNPENTDMSTKISNAIAADRRGVVLDNGSLVASAGLPGAITAPLLEPNTDAPKEARPSFDSPV